MIDSGSDLTLMQVSMFDKLKFRGLKPMPNMLVKSFSNDDIQIQGGFQCLIKLAPNHPGIPILVHVIPNIPNTPPLLLGNDFLKAGLATIGYEGSVSNPTAFVNFNPLVTGKFFLDFWAQIYRTGVLYDQTDRVKGIFHEINLSQIFLQKTARPCRDLWSLGYKVPEH
jgi:hypothetical protein